MTALNEIEEAIKETLQYFEDEFPLDRFPDRENWYVSDYAGGVTVGQLRALTQLAALRDGCVMVPRTPNKRIIAAMKKCEGGEYSIRESWTLIIEAATTEKPNDE